MRLCQQAGTYGCRFCWFEDGTTSVMQTRVISPDLLGDWRVLRSIKALCNSKGIFFTLQSIHVSAIFSSFRFIILFITQILEWTHMVCQLYILIDVWLSENNYVNYIMSDSTSSSGAADPYSSEVNNFTTLTMHCLQKGLQVGSVLGVAVVAPLAILLKLRAKKTVSLNQLVRYQLYSQLFGVGASLTMMMGKYVSWENKKECLRDRAYRIHKNADQNRVDDITTAAFLAAGSIYFLATSRFIDSIGASSPAIVGGLIYHIATRRKKNGDEETESEAEASPGPKSV